MAAFYRLYDTITAAKINCNAVLVVLKAFHGLILSLSPSTPTTFWNTTVLEGSLNHRTVAISHTFKTIVGDLIRQVTS